MAYSKISYIGDGSTTSYTTPSYIEKSHITVMLDGEQSFEHSWTGPNTITFNTAPSAGAVIEIVRNSSQQTRLVNYQQPSPLDAETLNRDSKQAFYMAQEALDESALALHRTPDGASYDAEGNPIINVGSPTNGTDVATKSYVDITVASGTPGGPITLFTVADYTELRGLTTAAYAANRVFVTSPAPGEFWHDAADTTSADDGGVIIVDASGRRWKRLESYAGYVCPTWWGAKPGGDASDNYTAIQAAIDKYTGLDKKIHKILFTRKGTYVIDQTLIIFTIGYVEHAFVIDMGGSFIQQAADNTPVIEVQGGVPHLWWIGNGKLGFVNGQPKENTNAICLSFAGGANDDQTGNGPHNGVIERIHFWRCAISIGVRDKDPSDTKFAVWDIRVQNCMFDAFSWKAFDLRDIPSFTITLKNFTIRSCYINDGYKTGLGSDPVMSFQNVMQLNIDDVEVIRTIRPVLYAYFATTTIRALSIENPGQTSTPFPSDCPYLLRFRKSPATIDGVNLMTLRSDVGEGNRMPLIYADSDEFNILPVTVGSIDMFRLASVTGAFCVFGGNQYGQIVSTTPVTYHETDYSVCSLFEYGVAKANNAVLGMSYLTYWQDRVKSITHTSGDYFIDLTVNPITCLVVNGVPTGTPTIRVYPQDNAASMSAHPHSGPGRYLKVYRTATGAFNFWVNWGSGQISIPANYKGVITLSWAPPCNWVVTDYSIWQ